VETAASSPPVAADAAPVEPTPPASAAPVAEPAFWDRLRARLGFADCDDNPLRTRWERIYTRGPAHFAQMLARALPSLEYVASEVEQRGLPGELALLPIVESQYQPIRGAGGVAGIWQMTEQTAREFGVQIDRGYDGRLDLVASTRGALALLEHLEREFPDDWRLADLAYNAGQYRVRRALLLNERAGRASDSDALKLSSISHEHLAKVEALACIVRDPQRFRVTLPEPDAGARLVAIELDAALDLELAARLAGMEMGALRALNAGWLRGRIDRAHASLVLPVARAETFAARWAQLPPAWRADFVFARLHAPVSWETLSASSGESAPLIAELNGHGAGAALPAGARLYLPALLVASLPAAIEAKRVEPGEPAPSSYRVRGGDSLWTIARRFDLTVAKLCEWNGLTPKSRLKPGQSLQLAPR
jgi:membrane-bound lytic murein transglycosylase D